MNGLKTPDSRILQCDRWFAGSESLSLVVYLLIWLGAQSFSFGSLDRDSIDLIRISFLNDWNQHHFFKKRSSAVLLKFKLRRPPSDI